MATRKWYAYRTLNITGRGDHGATCMGKTRHNNRCRWDIDSQSYATIRSYLDAIERCTPNEAVPWIQQLAELSLCANYHQNQISEVTSEFRDAIQDAQSLYDNGSESHHQTHDMQERLRIAQATAERLGTIIDNAKRTFGIQGSMTDFFRNLQHENATASQTLEVVRQLLPGTQREATECSERRRRVQAYQQGADEATNRISAAEDDQVQAEREHAEHVERLQTESASYQDAILKLVDDTKTTEAAWQAQEIEYRDAASKSETEGLAQSQHCTLVERQNDTLTAELEDYKANCDKQQEENKCLALELKASEEVRSQLTDDKITLELRDSEHHKSTQLGLALDEQKAIVSDLLAKQVSLSSDLAHLKVLLKAENQSPHLSQLSWKI